MDITLEPHVLKWARERAQLSTEELADKLRESVERVDAWEQSGELEYAQAKKLADKTHTPFGYLFLPEPLDESSLPIRDFRTVGMQQIPRPSLDLREAIYDAQELQAWYREYVVSSSGEPLAFVGSLKISDSVFSAAARIRNSINWTNVRTSSVENSLIDYVNAVRATHVLVIRVKFVRHNNNRRLKTEEFRGFSLADSYAPLIFINDNDAKAAQIFTLMHELVHIWLGETGVSNLTQTLSSSNEVERFCNKVAAEILVPLDEIKRVWRNSDDRLDGIRQAARYFRVSNLVMARRIYDAGYLDYPEFQALYDELEQSGKTVNKKEDDRGGGFVNPSRSRFGEQLLRALVGSVYAGKTPYREAMQLLGVSKPKTIDTLGKGLGMAT